LDENDMDRLVELTQSTSSLIIASAVTISFGLQDISLTDLLYRLFGFRYHGACQGCSDGALALPGREAFVNDHGPNTAYTVSGLQS
jgi:hypothetical protein